MSKSVEMQQKTMQIATLLRQLIRNEVKAALVEFERERGPKRSQGQLDALAFEYDARGISLLEQLNAIPE